MFLPYHQNLNFLFPRDLSEFVPVDHQSRIISDIIDQMDLSSFYARYSGIGAGDLPSEEERSLKMESKKTGKQGQIENGSRMHRLGSHSMSSYTNIYNNSKIL